MMVYAIIDGCDFLSPPSTFCTLHHDQEQAISWCFSSYVAHYGRGIVFARKYDPQEEGDETEGARGCCRAITTEAQRTAGWYACFYASRGFSYS